ncbi:MAG: ABC transporter ATP-binding protein [Myxococcales bacterium]|nr:ABC transporter ATP-binding protein [Myxococcales bacterium]
MPRQTQLTDAELLERYVGQAPILPRAVRVGVERQLGPTPIRLYALTDLDEARRFVERWVVLTDAELLVFSGDGLLSLCIERAQIGAIDSESGLSSHTVRLHRRGAGPGDEPMCVLRYTRRQQQVTDGLLFVLEEALEGRTVPTGDPDAYYQEGTAKAIRDAQALVSSHHLAVLWRLLSYLKPYRGRVVGGLLAAATITGLALVPPYLSGYLIDEVVGPLQAGELGREQAALVGWFAVAGIAVSYVLRQACQFVRLRLMAMLGELVARDLRTDLYKHLHSLSLGFFSRKKTGSLITRVSSDTDRLWEFLALGVVDVSLAATTLVGLGVILLHLDWRLGSIMVLPLPLVLLAIHWHGKHLERLFLRAWRRWSALTDVLSDTIPGMRVVQAFDQGPREVRRFGERNRGACDEFNRIHASWTAFWPVLMFFVQISVVGIWVFALPRLFGDGSVLGPQLSAGTFVSFLLYATMFTAPVEIIGQMTRIMNRATSSAHRVFEVLDSRPEVVERADPVKLEPLRGRVEFRDVAFAYDGVRQVLRGVSFAAEPGELIGLVGPSGGGKSTIVSLIARFYDVQSGTILIDGVDLRDLELGSYRRQVGMVLQDPYLFHGSVLENIRYGMEGATLAEVIAAARVANAHDFICKLPHGYDTVVGERGHTLSGGERQRISIARAVLENPRILILDEATSAVDTDTEFRIQEAMDRLVAGRTVFAIAHRLSTVRRASRLFVVEDGRITERGPHAELVQRPGGTYRRLHELQHALHEVN